MVPKDKWRKHGDALLSIDLAREVDVDEEILADDWEEFDYESSDSGNLFISFNPSTLTSFNKLLI